MKAPMCRGESRSSDVVPLCTVESTGQESLRNGGVVTARINTEPVVGDVYRLSPRLSVNGDAHGQAKRPAGVVELTEWTVSTITRTTVKNPPGNAMPSKANLKICLDKDGHWTDVNQRPFARHHLPNPEMCRYLGHLDEDETARLKDFWKLIDALGRRNF